MGVSGAARLRGVIAALTLWVPLAVVVGTWLNWRGALPEDLPRQWGPGGVTSTSPTLLMLAVLASMCLGSALIATFALRGKAAPYRRKTFFWSGFASGLACSIWVMTGAATVIAGSASDPEVGAWPLLVMASMGYGLIPFLISPRHATTESALEPAATGSSLADPDADADADQR